MQLLAAGVSTAQSATFDREVFAPVFFDDPKRAPSVAIADMNGDGVMDLVCGLNQIGFSVILGDDQTPERPFATDPMTGQAPTAAGVWTNGDTFVVNSVQVADVNSDGLLDVVISSAGGQEPLPGGGFTQFDGFIDVFVRDTDPMEEFNFVPVDCYPPGCVPVNGMSSGFPAFELQDMLLADVTNDGVLDMVTLHERDSLADVVRIWRGEFVGNTLEFQNPSTLSFSGFCGAAFNNVSSPRTLVVADLNVNPGLDLAATSGNLPQEQIEDQFTYWVNTGNSIGFAQGSANSVVTDANGFGDIESTWGLAAGDFDGDGDLELVTSHFFTGEIVFAIGDYPEGVCFDVPKQNKFDLFAHINDPLFNPTQLAAGDLDLDGLDDVVVVGQVGGAQKIYVLLNRIHEGSFGSGLGIEVVELDVASASLFWDVKVLDLNNDQRNDIVATGPGALVHVYYNTTSHFADLNGDGCVDGADLAQLLAMWGNPGAADFNGDGVVDGADLATLLANWGVGCFNDPGDPQFAMAPSEDGSVAGFGLVEEEAPAAHATTSGAPWIIAYFGFNNVPAYIEWVSLLDDEALFDHIAELLELILNENE